MIPLLARWSDRSYARRLIQPAVQSRSYELLFRHDATGLFLHCASFRCSLSRNDPPSLRPLTWTLLTGLIAGVLAGLFIHGSQPVQLLLVGAEVMVSLLFVLSFWWASTRIRYLWQGF